MLKSIINKLIKFFKKLWFGPSVPKEAKVEERPELKFIKIKLSAGITHAEVVKENPLTYLVRLSDGNVIKRHKASQVL